MARVSREKHEELEAFWRFHHDEWARGTLNQREYCELHGLPLKRFGKAKAIPMTLATIVLSVVWSLLVGQGPLEALIGRLSSFGGPPGSSGGNAQRRQHILEP